jgi:hypothetical protein
VAACHRAIEYMDNVSQGLAAFLLENTTRTLIADTTALRDRLTEENNVPDGAHS